MQKDGRTSPQTVSSTQPSEHRDSENAESQIHHCADLPDLESKRLKLFLSDPLFLPFAAEPSAATKKVYLQELLASGLYKSLYSNNVVQEPSVSEHYQLETFEKEEEEEEEEEEKEEEEKENEEETSKEQNEINTEGQQRRSRRTAALNTTLKIQRLYDVFGPPRDSNKEYYDDISDNTDESEFDDALSIQNDERSNDDGNESPYEAVRSSEVDLPEQNDISPESESESLSPRKTNKRTLVISDSEDLEIGEGSDDISMPEPKKNLPASFVAVKIKSFKKPRLLDSERYDMNGAVESHLTNFDRMVVRAPKDPTSVKKQSNASEKNKEYAFSTYTQQTRRQPSIRNYVIAKRGPRYSRCEDSSEQAAQNKAQRQRHYRRPGITYRNVHEFGGLPKRAKALELKPSSQSNGFKKEASPTQEIPIQTYFAQKSKTPLQSALDSIKVVTEDKLVESLLALLKHGVHRLPRLCDFRGTSYDADSLGTDTVSFLTQVADTLQFGTLEAENVFPFVTRLVCQYAHSQASKEPLLNVLEIMRKTFLNEYINSTERNTTSSDGYLQVKRQRSLWHLLWVLAWQRFCDPSLPGVFGLSYFNAVIDEVEQRDYTQTLTACIQGSLILFFFAKEPYFRPCYRLLQFIVLQQSLSKPLTKWSLILQACHVYAEVQQKFPCTSKTTNELLELSRFCLCDPKSALLALQCWFYLVQWHEWCVPSVLFADFKDLFFEEKDEIKLRDMLGREASYGSSIQSVYFWLLHKVEPDKKVEVASQLAPADSCLNEICTKRYLGILYWMKDSPELVLEYFAKHKFHSEHAVLAAIELLRLKRETVDPILRLLFDHLSTSQGISLEKKEVISRELQKLAPEYITELYNAISTSEVLLQSDASNGAKYVVIKTISRIVENSTDAVELLTATLEENLDSAGSTVLMAANKDHVDKSAKDRKQMLLGLAYKISRAVFYDKKLQVAATESTAFRSLTSNDAETLLIAASEAFVVLLKKALPEFQVEVNSIIRNDTFYKQPALQPCKTRYYKFVCFSEAAFARHLNVGHERATEAVAFACFTSWTPWLRMLLLNRLFGDTWNCNTYDVCKLVTPGFLEHARFCVPRHRNLMMTYKPEANEIEHSQRVFLRKLFQSFCDRVDLELDKNEDDAKTFLSLVMKHLAIIINFIRYNETNRERNLWAIEIFGACACEILLKHVISFGLGHLEDNVAQYCRNFIRANGIPKPLHQCFDTTKTTNPEHKYQFVLQFCKDRLINETNLFEAIEFLSRMSSETRLLLLENVFSESKNATETNFLVQVFSELTKEPWLLSANEVQYYSEALVQCIWFMECLRKGPECVSLPRTSRNFSIFPLFTVQSIKHVFALGSNLCMTISESSDFVVGSNVNYKTLETVTEAVTLLYLVSLELMGAVTGFEMDKQVASKNWAYALDEYLKLGDYYDMFKQTDPIIQAYAMDATQLFEPVSRFWQTCAARMAAVREDLKANVEKIKTHFASNGFRQMHERYFDFAKSYSLGSF